MIRRRTPRTSSHIELAPAFSDIHEWVRSLPWVVEESTDARWPGIRAFVVDCPPLDRHRFLLASHPAGQTAFGQTYGIHLAAIMPIEASDDAEAARWNVHNALPLAAGNALVTIGGEVMRERDAVEAFVLAAYSYAMS
jgi:hypothetical protein